MSAEVPRSAEEAAESHRPPVESEVLEFLARVRELDEQATPGPWVVRAWDREECWPGEEGRNRYVCSGSLIDRRYHMAGGHVASVDWHVDDSEVVDADLIAEFRSLCPRLVGVVEELQTENERLERSKVALVNEVKRLQDRVAVLSPGWKP